MARMRVSQHSGRQGSAKHNDRSFLRGKTQEERMEIAPHIRPEAERGNRVWRRQKGMTLEEEELLVYRQRYAAGLEARNERYRRSGHKERCRTIDQLYHDPKMCPEEMILQIGNADSSADDKTLAECAQAYMHELSDWSREHGNCMMILDMALHVDETTPHIHLRRCWQYKDKDENLVLGQNKALKAAGIALPDPDKPEGRYNNRKMTFDAWARSRWQEICKAHGLEIETEPVKGRRHKETQEFVYDQLRAENDQIRAERDKLIVELDETRQQTADAVRDRDASVRELSEARERSLALREENLTLKAQNKALRGRNSALEGQIRRLDTALEAAREGAASRQPKKRLFREPVVEVPPSEWEAVTERAILNSELGTLDLRRDAAEIKQLADDYDSLKRDEAARCLEKAQEQSRRMISSAREQKLSLEDTMANGTDISLIRKEHPELFDRKGRYRRTQEHSHHSHHREERSFEY